MCNKIFIVVVAAAAKIPFIVNVFVYTCITITSHTCDTKAYTNTHTLYTTCAHS